MQIGKDLTKTSPNVRAVVFLLRTVFHGGSPDVKTRTKQRRTVNQPSQLAIQTDPTDDIRDMAVKLVDGLSRVRHTERQ